MAIYSVLLAAVIGAVQQSVKGRKQKGGGGGGGGGSVQLFQRSGS